MAVDLIPHKKPKYRTGHLFIISIMISLLLGLVAIVMVGNTSLDIQLHDTMFVISYSAILLVLALLLVIQIPVYFLFPRLIGRNLNETMGKIHFWLTMISLFICFFGFRLSANGAGRNLANAEFGTLKIIRGYEILILVALLLFFLAQISFALNMVYSLFRGKKVRNT